MGEPTRGPVPAVMIWSEKPSAPPRVLGMVRGLVPLATAWTVTRARTPSPEASEALSTVVSPSSSMALLVKPGSCIRGGLWTPATVAKASLVPSAAATVTELGLVAASLRWRKPAPPVLLMRLIMETSLGELEPRVSASTTSMTLMTLGL